MAETLTDGRRRRRARAPLHAGARNHPARHRLAMVLVWVAASLGAPWLAPYPPAEIDFLAISQPPSAAHWFGTDQLGRDMLSRVMHGGTYVLTIAPAATLLGLVLGTAIGLTTAWFGSWVDEVVMRVLDAVMAFPIVILAMLALTFLGAGTGNVILVIGLVFAPLIARTVRAAALVEARKEYVQAAQLRGEGVPLHHGGRIAAQRARPADRRRDGPARLRRLHLGDAGLPGPRRAAAHPRLGPDGQREPSPAHHSPLDRSVSSTGIAWVVVAIGLAADGLKEYLEP